MKTPLSEYRIRGTDERVVWTEDINNGRVTSFGILFEVLEENNHEISEEVWRLIWG